MRKWIILLTIAALLGGCSEPASPEPAASKDLNPVTGPAVDWFDAFDPQRSETVAPLTDNACPTTGTDLSLQKYDPAWRIHPLSRGKREFYVPSTDAITCNTSTAPVKNQTLTLSETWRVRLPNLQPGQAAGPLRLYTPDGVPEAVMKFWTAGGKQPPAPNQEIPQNLPQEPTLQELRQLAWSSGETSQNGKKTELFLYAPDITYRMATDYYCGALPGSINAAAKTWALYTSSDGGAPVKAADIGGRSFEGGRGMKVEPAPAPGGVTFLLFANYGSCANPNWYQMYAYDHATGKALPVQMKREDGKVDGATVTNYSFTSDSKLINKLYNNADGVGWHTYTYTWEKSSFTWLFQEHIKGEKSP